MTDVVSSIPKDFGTSSSGGKNAIRKYAHKVATTAATTAIAATYLSAYTNANPITSIGSSSTSSSESSSSYDLKDDTTITDNTYYQLYFNPLELVGSFVNHSFPSSFSSSPSTVVSEDTVNSAQYHSSSSFLEDTIETMNESTSSSFSFSSLLQPRISSRGSPMFPSFSLLSSLVASATSSSSPSSSSSLSSSSEVISLNDTFLAPLLSSMNFNYSSASELHSSLESSLLFNRSSSDEDIISSSSPVTSDNSALFPWLDSDLQFLYSIPHPKSGYTTLSIVLLAFFITIIMILVVVGNLLVCIAITTEKSLKTVQNWFIASLAVSDLLLGLVIMPFSLAYELMGYWIFGELWCDIHHALDVLLCTASINNLCLISLDRYWSVTQAVEYLKKRTPSRAIAMICFVWIFSALVSLPPLVGWKKEMSPGECELSNDSGYVIYSSVGSFYGPAVVMVFVYVKIFFAARSRARKHVKKRKFLVQPEVTNDPIRDKSTTTTTCTSLSNPSPPDGAQNSDQCSTFPAANSTASNIFNSKDPSTNRTNNNNNNNNNSNSNNNNNNTNDFNSSNVSSATQPMATRTVSSPLICTSGSVTTAIGRSSTERSSLKYRNESHHYGDSRPETPTTPTPKVTFSPNDTVFDADEGITNFCTPNDHHQCPSNCATPSVSPTTRSPPQIVVETPENKQLRRLSQICPTPNVSSVRSDDRSSINNHPVPPSSLLSTTSNRSNSSHNSGNNKEIDSREMNDMNYRRNSDNLDRPDENDVPVLKKKKCPKLRISIRGSNKNRESKSDKKNANEICALVSTISPGTTTTTLPSILRQNGGHPPIGSGNKMISADDDSDTVESPVSKSGSVALESKLYLSAPKLARSPYGSSMSIADYDDSDLCNESGESDSKSASNSSNRQSGSGGYRKGKRKGKVQYQTPPSSGHHTTSDAERHRRKVAKARERRATLILGLIMGSFIMAWVPFFVMYLLSGLCKRCTVDKLLKFGYWLGYCNSAINPIIYTVFNRDFRKAFRKILFK